MLKHVVHSGDHKNCTFKVSVFSVELSHELQAFVLLGINF